ncbi:MAG: PEP-CTERM sorting domain-containing protein [Pirellulales bacterium]|nr:PEP-CTERM sorting domain-containing protein [Pirellulales bacterium]
MSSYRMSLVFAVIIVIAVPSVYADPWMVDSFFDITYDTSIGPPYPATTSVEVEIANPDGPVGPLLPAGRQLLRLENTVPELALELKGYTEGGMFAVDSFFDITYKTPGIDFPAESFFDVFFDTELPDGTKANVIGQPDVSFAVDSFFDITYQIEFEHGPETLSLNGELAPGLDFVNVSVGDEIPPDSFFDVFFEIEIDETESPLDVLQPIMQFTMHGTLFEDYIPGDANRDGSVDVSDLGILAANYNIGGGLGWSNADFTADGHVDVSDLGVLALHYGEGPTAQVPEPSTFVGLLGLCLAGLFALPRRKR